MASCGILRYVTLITYLTPFLMVSEKGKRAVKQIHMQGQLTLQQRIFQP